jgi:ferredoxin-thioredoxin reductase catalytic subunit
MTTDQEEDETFMLKWVNGIAKKQQVILNPDITIVNRVIRGLTVNKKKYGRPYCPCRVRTGKAEIDADIECPCKYLKSEIITMGRCTCQLYYKEA